MKEEILTLIKIVLGIILMFVGLFIWKNYIFNNTKECTYELRVVGYDVDSKEISMDWESKDCKTMHTNMNYLQLEDINNILINYEKEK